MLKNIALVSWMILIKSETAYILQAPIKIGCLVATWTLSLEGKPLLYIFPAIIYSYSNVTKWHKWKLIIYFSDNHHACQIKSWIVIRNTQSTVNFHHLIIVHYEKYCSVVFCTEFFLHTHSNHIANWQKEHSFKRKSPK